MPVLGLALTLCAGLFLFSLAKAASQFMTFRAESDADMPRSISSYTSAIDIDSSNAAANYLLASLLFSGNQYPEAASQYQAAIRKGLGTSATYSYLISAHALAGDDPAAIEVAAEALSVFPNSVFLLTRYAILLKQAGRGSEAEEHLAKARNINARQAETWLIVITQGSEKAAAAGRNGTGVPLLVDLYPASGLYAVLAERQIRFPEEKPKVFDN